MYERKIKITEIRMLPGLLELSITRLIFKHISCSSFLSKTVKQTGRKFPWRSCCVQFINTGNRSLGNKERNYISTLEYLRARIKSAGPLTVSEYMTSVLINPQSGYYMKKDVFGKKGDFITSPEISQMFGELLAVWIIHEWSQLGSQIPIQLVELGPGRGTLAEDILRVFKQLTKLPEDAVSLHLVEVSPKMREMQNERLTNRTRSNSKDKDFVESGSLYKTAVSKTGVPIYWYDTLSHVPKGFSCFIAHEYLDALPIHKFQKTDSGWREVLVDIDASNNPQALRFVLSAGATPASTVFVKADESRDNFEVSPHSGIVVQELADRIASDGGMALIVDYGHSGEKTDTLRAFKEHKLHEVLAGPGSADVTADVDFNYLKQVVGSKVSTYGPVQQGMFLQMLGIQTRLKALLMQATPSQHKDLVSGYKMLTDPAQMGERFKMWSILPKRSTRYSPAGFPVEEASDKTKLNS